FRVVSDKLVKLSRPAVSGRFLILSATINVVSFAFNEVAFEDGSTCALEAEMATNRVNRLQKKQVNVFNVNYECYFCVYLKLPVGKNRQKRFRKHDRQTLIKNNFKYFCTIFLTKIYKDIIHMIRNLNVKKLTVFVATIFTLTFTTSSVTPNASSEPA